MELGGRRRRVAAGAHFHHRRVVLRDWRRQASADAVGPPAGPGRAAGRWRYRRQGIRLGRRKGVMIWRGASLGFDRDGKPIDYHAGDDAGGNAPCLVLGPPGSFKSVGPIACQLLDDDSGARSYVIFGDGKAELTAITSKFRRTISHVAIANYAGVLVDKRPDLKRAGYNALKNLDPKARGFAEACEAAAIAIVKPEPGDRNKHFTDAARSAAMLAISREVKQARAEGRPADIGRVRAFLLQEPKKLKEAIEEIMRTGDEDERTRAAK